jgi:hypothetical protein
MQCKREENLQNCPCSFPDCPRKGKCCECVEHHRRKGEIVACFFPVEAEMETMNDRSAENFIKAHEKSKKQKGE